MPCSPTPQSVSRPNIEALSSRAWSWPVCCVLVAAGLTACAPIQPAATVSAANSAATAPAALRPADSERALFVWSATGSQIYECRSNEKGGFGWAFVAPEADLFSQSKSKVGSHGAGPFWAASDGSRTVGTVKARADGAGPNDIPLLLLSARSTGSGGTLAGVTSVQRLNTRGGSAPADGCATAADASKRIRQAYTADYVFFAPK